MTHPRSTTFSTLLVAIGAAATLAACDSAQDGRTAGQQVDRAVAKVEKKADEVQADMRAAGEQAKQSAVGAMDAVANKAQDAAITASVNAELAKDPQLSALRINVDTANGAVALRGTAPSAISRDRASALAQRVEGVKSVDNQLTVTSKS